MRYGGANVFGVCGVCGDFYDPHPSNAESICAPLEMKQL